MAGYESMLSLNNEFLLIIAALSQTATFVFLSTYQPITHEVVCQDMTLNSCKCIPGISAD